MRALQIILSLAVVTIVTSGLYIWGSIAFTPETLDELPRPWELTTLEDRSARPLSEDMGNSSSPRFDCTYRYTGGPFTDTYGGGEIITPSDFDEAIHSLSYWREVAARDYASTDMPPFQNDVVQLVPNCRRLVIELPVLTDQDQLDQVDWIDMAVNRTPRGSYSLVEILGVSRPGVEGAITFAQELNLLATGTDLANAHGDRARTILYIRMVPTN